MPVDMTALEPDGLQIHIRLNDLLGGYGFFTAMSIEQKAKFDSAVEKILSDFMPYDD